MDVILLLSTGCCVDEAAVAVAVSVVIAGVVLVVGLVNAVVK